MYESLNHALTGTPYFLKSLWIYLPNTGLLIINLWALYLFKRTSLITASPNLLSSSISEIHAKKAGFTKRISPHTLRHAFATHLLENGVEFRYIQTLLGHRDPKSTEVYLHLSNKTVLGITSPFDREVGDLND